MEPDRDRRSLRRTLIALLLALAAVGGAGAASTWATFTVSASVSQAAVTSSTLTLSVPGAGATNRLTLGAAAIVPGDTMQRVLDLTNGGTDDLSAVTLTTTAGTSSLLDTDVTNGLQLAIDKCSVAWTEAGTTPAFTYTCSGGTSTVLASRPVIGSALALSNLASLTSGSTDHLRVTLTFPSGAGNTLQTQSSAITYAFTGAQRAATNR